MRYIYLIAFFCALVTVVWVYGDWFFEIVCDIFAAIVKRIRM